MNEKIDDFLLLLMSGDEEDDTDSSPVAVIEEVEEKTVVSSIKDEQQEHQQLEENEDSSDDYDDELKYKYAQAYESFSSGEVETPEPILETEFADEPHFEPEPEITEPAQKVVAKSGFRPEKYSTPKVEITEEEKKINYPVSVMPFQDEVYFTCPEGKITSSGIHLSSFKKINGKDEVITTLKHPYYIFPLEVYRAIDSDNAAFVKLQFMNIADEVGEVFLPNADMNNFSKRGELLQAGFPPPPANIISRLSSLILSALKALPKEKKSFVGYAKPGWTEDGKYHIRPGHPKHIGIGAEYGTLMKAGSKKLQYNAIKAAIDDALLTAAVMSAAIAGYMRGRIWKTSVAHSLVLHGEKSRGKSAQLMGVSAIQGKPTSEGKTNFFSGKSTEASLDRELSGNNHGVAVIDDSDDVLIADKKKGMSRFMNFGNKGGNTRMENGVSTTYSYDLTIFLSFNANYLDLISGNDKSEALSSRMIGIDINHPFLTTFSDVNKVNDYRNALLENYGHMYEDIIEYINNNDKKIKDKYNKIFTEICDDKAMYILKEKEPRALEFLAICYAGADALGEILGDKKYTVKAVEAIDILVAEYRSENVDNKINIEQEKKIRHYSVYSCLKEFIQTNPNRFYWKTMAFCEPNDAHFNSKQDIIKLQKGKAKDINNRLSGNNTVLGIVNINNVMSDESDLNGFVMLNEAGYRELEKSYGITKTALLQSVRTLNMLADEKAKLNVDIQKRNNFILSRGVKIILSEMEILSETPEIQVITTNPDDMFDVDSFENSYANLRG